MADMTAELLTAGMWLLPALLVALLCGAAGAWLVGGSTMPRPAADALERFALRLDAQEQAIARAETAGFSQIEAAEAERHRARTRLQDISDLLSRLAQAQRDAELAADRRSLALLGKARKRSDQLEKQISRLAKQLEAVETRLAALERDVAVLAAAEAAAPNTLVPVDAESEPAAAPEPVDDPLGLRNLSPELRGSVDAIVPTDRPEDGWTNGHGMEPIDLPDRVIALVGNDAGASLTTH
ncbi:MAG: hypothetical protein AAGC57_11580 [Pseudomonadota bacterium]